MPTRADYCVVACAEAWRGDGEVLASPFGVIPVIGARLARATFSPDLVITDGEATVVAADGSREGWLPFSSVLADVVPAGRRHVMMGASQIDAHGNQNISCIGQWERPKVQLIGARGGPGNTINHATSYWVPNHSPRVFVESVDFVSGVGCDRAVGPFHDLRYVITNLGMFDFVDSRMRVASLHPGVERSEVVDATGFDLAWPDEVRETRAPTDAERDIIAALDPDGRREREVAS